MLAQCPSVSNEDLLSYCITLPLRIKAAVDDTMSHDRHQRSRLLGFLRGWRKAPARRRAGPESDPPDWEPLSAMRAHLREHIGEIVHEHEVKGVHVRLLCISPHEGFPHAAIITSGMSAYAMPVPDDEDHAQVPRRAELMLLLPQDWELDAASLDEAKNGWLPILMHMLAFYPWSFGTFLANGHSMDLDMPFGETSFSSVLLAHVPGRSRGFHRVRVNSGAEGCNGEKSIAEEEIALYNVLPLYPEEVAFKREHGTAAIFERLRAHGVMDALRPGRVNTALVPLPPREEWPDDNLVDCDGHGPVLRAYVCCHLLQRENAPLGFHQPGDLIDGEVEQSPESAPAEAPDMDAAAAGSDGELDAGYAADREEEDDDNDRSAWCDACDAMLLREREWTDVAMAHADVRLVCEFCFYDISRLHRNA